MLPWPVKPGGDEYEYPLDWVGIDDDELEDAT